jgi:pantoate--beta-alanine ligase
VRVHRSGAELRRRLGDGPRGVVGLVPTMGALHEGHLTLLRRARDASDEVVMSLFVNPLQFGPGEDLGAYPRDEARDLELAEAEKVDAVFAPAVHEMYPPGNETRVSVGPIGDVFEGASRPGHFDGVATVVAKLFNLVAPDLAFFGHKDAQQVAVIKQLVEGLGWPLEIVVCPTVRDADGLALSSRNAYLSSSDRARALVLWKALQEAGRAFMDAGDPDAAAAAGRRTIGSQEGVELDYLEAVNPETFARARSGEETLFITAARVGPTRLIDNLLVDAPE